VNSLRWSNEDFASIMEFLCDRTGLSFRDDQRENTENSVRRVMTGSGMDDLSQYSRQLRRDRQLLNNLIAELTIGETYFFREPNQFRFIEKEVLPSLRAARGDNHPLRLWSAACASGEEPYSLAILCESVPKGTPFEILATDISEASLAKARTACYGDWSLRGDAMQEIRGYAKRVGERIQLDAKLTKKVKFESLNLSSNGYPSQATRTVDCDLILCRNVLIYFDRQTVIDVTQRLFASLAPGGWLIVASGDPPVNQFADFEVVRSSGGVYYRRPLQPASKTPTPKQVNPVTFRATPQPALPPVTPINIAKVETELATQIASVNDSLHAKPVPANESIELAKAAFDQGRYQDVLKLTAEQSSSAASTLHVRALACIDQNQAKECCVKFLEKHPLSSELHYLHALVLVESQQQDAAIEAATRATFLDRNIAPAHFLLGVMLRQQGELERALRHFRNAEEICIALPAESVAPLSDGETARHLASAAAQQANSIRNELESST